MQKRITFVVLAICLLAGCSGMKKATKAPHPLAGSWNYTLDTPQGIYTGVMTFMEVEDMLNGTIADDNQPDQAAPLNDLSFDTQMSQVTFKFDGGEYGTMTVTSVLEGDTMKGSMYVGAYDVNVALTAMRNSP